MAPKPTGVLTWDVAEIARVLKVEPEDVHEYFTDGRRVSFLLERRLAKEIIKGTLASNEGAGYDLIDPSGKKWEVRSVTSSGIYFCPSYMVGSGRAFDEPGFLRKLKEIEGYIVSDVERFPNIPFWIVHRDVVLQWWQQRQLGSTSKISRDRALVLLAR